LKKVVAYLTSGYPEVQFTKDLISKLSEHIDILELGVPFSDPVADGEVIEKANLLALQKGVKFDHVLEIAKESKIPTYLMGYFNSFYNRGINKLLSEMSENRITGTIIPDLPHEEAELYFEQFKNKNIDLIPFVAPTDSKERISKILKDSQSRFIYLVAYAGITGSGKSEDLQKIISDIKEVSQNDLFVGFGVNEKTAKEKSKGVDGVIVGSAFVKHLLDNSLSNSQKIQKIVSSAKIIKEEINS
jgi:tryptophan synthase alpha chain